ncbi:MAG: ribonuclease III [Pseudomonadota bacterium]
MRTPNLKPLMGKLGYTFKNEALLLQALTHRSFGPDNYERLEFLGDGLLNGLAALLVYQKYPKLDEGELTRLRVHLVRGQTLAELAHTFELQMLVRLGLGEARSGAASLNSILSDVVEAIIGAIYLDSGWAECEQVVFTWLHPWVDALPKKGDELLKDPKSTLQEWVQARQKSLPVYSLIGVTGPGHQQMFKVSCHVATIQTEGVASSRRIAEQIAAEAALEQLKRESK